MSKNAIFSEIFPTTSLYIRESSEGIKKFTNIISTSKHTSPNPNKFSVRDLAANPSDPSSTTKHLRWNNHHHPMCSAHLIGIDFEYHCCWQWNVSVAPRSPCRWPKTGHPCHPEKGSLPNKWRCFRPQRREREHLGCFQTLKIALSWKKCESQTIPNIDQLFSLNFRQEMMYGDVFVVAFAVQSTVGCWLYMHTQVEIVYWSDWIFVALSWSIYSPVCLCQLICLSIAFVHIYLKYSVHNYTTYG